MDARPSIVEDVDFMLRPGHLEVLITGITRRNGAPLPIRCVKPDADEIASVLGFLPGEHPEAPQQQAPTDANDQIKAWAPALIERWAKVERRGEWVPAFSFATPCPEDRLPGSELTTIDLAQLSMAIMTLGGYGGADASLRFLGERGGSGGSNGALASGEGHR